METLVIPLPLNVAVHQIESEEMSTLQEGGKGWQTAVRFVSQVKRISVGGRQRLGEVTRRTVSLGSRAIGPGLVGFPTRFPYFEDSDLVDTFRILGYKVS
ncbi:MAG: hypothetical protein CMJ81_23770 [Planctomycetaceae bacterium]|nr:hypothetical protein [Planctomycetaceae bacterium]MBP63263.1 hypothetical protein [Planctomycetaceae bacterium]